VNLNSRPINYNRSRRLPANCCLLCGAKLGNFVPINAYAAIGHGSGKIQGWTCRDGCGDDELIDDDDWDESVG
jgi:hypothetical protein